MTNLDIMLKSRDITLPTKVHLVKAMAFPVAMYGWESWTIKKAECWRIDAFELWCWRRLLRVPWTARRSNQLILKEISPEYSLEGLMLMLKLQYFGHMMRRTDSLGKTLILGKIEGRRRRGQERMRWLDGITDSWTWVWVGPGNWWWIGKPGVLQHGVAESDTTEPLNYYTVCVHHVFSVHSPVHGHVGCFHILVFVINAVVNIEHVCIFSNYSFFWIYAQEWHCWITWQLYFWFSEETSYYFP